VTAQPRAVPKLLVLGTAAAAILVLLAGGARTWVTGQVSDPVLAQTAVTVTGREAAAGVVATALVAAAAALAAVTGGRVVRWIGAIALTAAGLLAGALTLTVLLDAGAVVGRQAATQTGRTGSVEATGDPTMWVYLSLLAAAVLVLAGGAAVLGVRRWGGLASRYDAPTEAQPARRGVEEESDWDRLSRGEDPT
jgi:Tryptophan-associated transmembrane protein (Trp_oprn_chp)